MMQKQNKPSQASGARPRINSFYDSFELCLCKKLNSPSEGEGYGPKKQFLKRVSKVFYRSLDHFTKKKRT